MKPLPMGNRCIPQSEVLLLLQYDGVRWFISGVQKNFVNREKGSP